MTERQPFDHPEPPHLRITAPGFAGHLLADRRGILAAAIGVVGAGALAACSSPPVVSTGPSAPAGGPTSDAGGTGVDTPTPAGTPTSDIPVGGGKIYPDQQVVVTQPAAGQFKAFSAI